MSIRLVVDPVQSLAFSSIGAAYMGVGPVFDESARMVTVTNLTDAYLMLSWDGVNDHIPVPFNSIMTLTISQNSDEEDEYFALPAQSRLYVKQIDVPVSGTVYVTHFRGVNDA